MEIAKLLLDYIKVLIWPGVAIFVLLKFRGNISDLISRTRTLSTPAGSLEFAEEVRALREAVETQDEVLDPGEAATAREEPRTRADRTAFDTYRDIARIIPEASVLASWLHLEKKLKEAVDMLYADVGGSRAFETRTSGTIHVPTTRKLAHALGQKGWDEDWVRLVDDLRRVRNQAAHQSSISPATASDYVESCEFLVLAIDEFVGNR